MVKTGIRKNVFTKKLTNRIVLKAYLEMLVEPGHTVPAYMLLVAICICLASFTAGLPCTYNLLRRVEYKGNIEFNKIYGIGVMNVVALAAVCYFGESEELN